MQGPTSLTDPNALLVADASVVINLNACGQVREILQALPNHMVVTAHVMDELRNGALSGRRDSDLLVRHVRSGLIDVVALGGSGLRHFEDLVIGAAARTLNDGEAATIGYAIEHSGVALIDERKANRICADRFHSLRTACTVDVFAHPSVTQALGPKQLGIAVKNALVHARMSVLPHQMDWVVSLVGAKHLAECTSLPATVRNPNGSVS